MTRYDDLKAAIELDKVEASVLDRLLREYPDLPADFVDFLREIGAGDLGGQLMLYGGIVNPEEIYGNTPSLHNVVLIADDYKGFGYGFDTRSWSMVEFDSSTQRAIKLDTRFEEFIRQILAK